MKDIALQNVRFDERGIVPAIVQDATTGDVLALVYMDNADLLATLQTGRASFFRRAAAGEPTKDSYPVEDVRVNPDGGSLTVLVLRDTEMLPESKPVSLLRDFAAVQKSKSEVSLVDAGSMEFGLAINKLYTLITERKEQRPEGSYTTYLFNSGIDKILKKVAEESGEVIIAAKNKSTSGLVSELADLFYHLLVLMVERDLKLGDVHNELSRRAAQAPKGAPAGDE
ncbi:MAG TPA: phosphoribosyl-ATP diphosphatase [Blastocatellia bacterium]|nr:phosphoribosyl-ATP diphosphatase [Blastocatellia bacterium]